MKIGVTMFLSDVTASAVELATEAEARGFHSVYFPEHTHIPVARLTPPPTGDEVLDEGYARTLDPFIALAAAGQATSRIRLGTGVALPAWSKLMFTRLVGEVAATQTGWSAATPPPSTPSLWLAVLSNAVVPVPSSNCQYPCNPISVPARVAFMVDRMSC